MADLGKESEPKKVSGAIFDKADDSKLSKTGAVEMLSGLLQGLFYVPAQAFGHKHWLLSNTEAEELAKAIFDCLKTLPAKQGKKVDKFLKEYAPIVKLAVVAGSITINRVSLTMQLRDQEKNERNAANRIDGNDTAANTGNSFGPNADFIQ